MIAALRTAQDWAQAGHWVVGFVAYEAAPAFDPALACHPPVPGLPLASFAAYAAAGTWHPPEIATDSAFRYGPWRAENGRRQALAQIETLRAGIRRGDYYQVNLTQRWRAAFEGDPYCGFLALRETQPEGYGAYLDGGNWQILSVSPELFFEWTPEGRLLTRPMKGTAARGLSPEADHAAAIALAFAAKERAENLMIVDLLRNDVSRVARTGSVTVPRLFQVESLPTAWQMTSTVECVTRPDVDLAAVFRALFPCGSVTGAPKHAAMKAIAARESSPRGAYCGAIGILEPGGHTRFNVGIRTVSIDRRLARAECGIGSGITLDSVADDEWAEWLVKRRFLLRASADFSLLETLRLEEGQYWLLDRHLRRLAGSAAHFGFAYDETGVGCCLDELAAGHGQGTWRIRLLLDRRGNCQTEIFALEPASVDITVAWAATPVDGEEEFLRHKTTRREMYACHAPASGVFDTLLWNAAGEITEFTRGNVVLELDGRQVTPALSSGLLPGVLRAELLARGEVEEAVLRREDVAQATGLWFINSVRGRVPARLR